MLFDEAMYKELLKENEERFSSEISKLRTGKATMDTFDKIQVESYGTMMGLNGVAKIIFEGPINIVIQVWDKSNQANVRKALENANLGASINDQGEQIRVNFLPLTEEDRKETVKQLGQITEEFRVRARRVRHDFNQEVKELEGVSEDEQNRDLATIQKLLDESIDRIEEMARTKTLEILPGNK